MEIHALLAKIEDEHWLREAMRDYCGNCKEPWPCEKSALASALRQWMQVAKRLMDEAIPGSGER